MDSLFAICWLILLSLNLLTWLVRSFSRILQHYYLSIVPPFPLASISGMLMLWSFRLSPPISWTTVTCCWYTLPNLRYLLFLLICWHFVCWRVIFLLTHARAFSLSQWRRFHRAPFRSRRRAALPRPTSRRCLTLPSSSSSSLPRRRTTPFLPSATP